MQPTRRALSGDSHVAEIDATFAEIDPAYSELRPRAVYDPEQGGALFHVPNFELARRVPMGLVCTAGRAPEQFGAPVDWHEIHPAGYDGKRRLEVQDEDGIGAEIIYPSLGLVLCSHPDVDYRKACFDAYNRWLLEFSDPDRERLVPLPLLALRSPEEGVREVEEAKRQGFKGVLLSGHAVFDDFDQPSYDPIWEACAALGLPVSFHILTTPSDDGVSPRGHQILQHMVMTRGVQDIVSMLIFGAVFERHPDLRVVCVEVDAGWVPHFKFRMDHAYRTHRHWQRYDALSRLPSEYFDENVYVTFQNDESVRFAIHGMNAGRILWATDFPHGDGTHPHTQRVIAEIGAAFDEDQRRAVFHDNTAALYALDV